MELGAFVAGVAVSATPYADQTLHSLEPFRNIFTALFLTSIGLIMNPYFLWLHLDVLVMSVFAVIIFKTTLIAVVVRAFGYNLYTSFTVGVSLAQVGELSFVLLSRASGANLVERKLYLLLLGTTALSLIFTPTLFRATPSLLRFAAVARFISKDELSEELSSSSK
jgi:Kef-type K+ transport system membrane component KefB